MAIDSFMSPLGGPREEHSQNAQLKRKRVKYVRPVAEVSAARDLVEALIEILLFGGNKKCFGFKVLEGEALPGLTILAPGVFHMPYLKVSTSVHEMTSHLLNTYIQGVSDRADVIPTIATSLARMINAESPSLRKKVADLRSSSNDGVDDSTEMTIQGIEKGTWNVLLKNIKVPALQPRASMGQQECGSPEPSRLNEGREKRPLLSLEELPNTPQLDRPGQTKTLEIWTRSSLPTVESPILYSSCASPISHQQFNPHLSPPTSSYGGRSNSPIPLYWSQITPAHVPIPPLQAWQQPKDGYPANYQNGGSLPEPSNMAWTPEAQQARAAEMDPGNYDSLDEWMYGQMGIVNGQNMGVI